MAHISHFLPPPNSDIASEFNPQLLHHTLWLCTKSNLTFNLIDIFLTVSESIGFPTKVKFYKSLLLSILLYGGENWTLRVETPKRVQTVETKCFRRFLGISWRENKNTIPKCCISSSFQSVENSVQSKVLSTQFIPKCWVLSSFQHVEYSVHYNVLSTQFITKYWVPCSVWKWWVPCSLQSVEYPVHCKLLTTTVISKCWVLCSCQSVVVPCSFQSVKYPVHYKVVSTLFITNYWLPQSFIKSSDDCDKSKSWIGVRCLLVWY